MNAAKVIQFPTKQTDPQPLRGADMSTDQKDDGYTKMPNYLIDDDYVAKITGNALKCYVVISRFTEGFNRKNWAIESKFLQTKTGIKKPHTLFEAVKQLEEFKLLSVHREEGKTNKFTIANPCLKTAVPKNGTTAENGQGGSAENGHNTHAENGHTKKEKKERKEEKENINDDEREQFVAQNRSMLQFIEYHQRDKKRYSLKELSEVYPVASDFQKQAMVSFPELSSTEILDLLKKLGQWSLTATAQTSQGWMGSWLTFLKNRQSELQGQAAKAAKAAKAPEQKAKPRHRYGQGVVSKPDMRDVGGSHE